MRSRCKLSNCVRDVLTDAFVISILVDDINVEEINELSGKELEVDLHQYKESRKRSLDANAYFHVLVGKLADKQHTSKPYMKNLMLARYGQREIGTTLLIPSDIPMEQREDIHVAACGYEEVNEVIHTRYEVIRGSHTYTREEMKILIDGTVEDAKELGIETMTPDELRRMYSTWHNQ